MQSIETMEYLVAQKLATKSVNGDLVTFRYNKKLKDKTPWSQELVECRGHTYDLTTGQIVLHPLPKLFYIDDTLANPYVQELLRLFSTEKYCTVGHKFNGFMASATLYKGRLVVGTTGTTNSDFAKLARQYINIEHQQEGITRVYEIIDPCDPHIIAGEPTGANLLGFRYHGQQYSMINCLHYYHADNKGVLNCPHLWPVDSAVFEAKQSLSEGLVLQGSKTGLLFKVKSNYYTGKKRLMRSKKPINIELLPGPWAQLKPPPARFWGYSEMERRLWIECNYDQQYKEFNDGRFFHR